MYERLQKIIYYSYIAIDAIYFNELKGGGCAMRKRWYIILALFALGLCFYVSKTSEYFVSINYNRDTFNWLQTIQNVWFLGILAGICFAGYKTKKVLIPTVCAALFICSVTSFNEGHYSDVYILEPARVIAEEEGVYQVIPLEPEDGREKNYRAVSLLDEPLREDVYDWVDLEYHDSTRYGRQCYITQVSE